MPGAPASEEKNRDRTATDVPRPLTPVDGLVVGDLLRAGAARHPERAFLIYEHPDGAVENFSWAQVLERSEQTAARLELAGIGVGDRIHLHLSNRSEFLFLWFAAALLGASIVPTNTASSADEIAYIVGHARTRLSVTEASYDAVVGDAVVRAGSGSDVWSCDREELRNGVPAAADLPAVSPLDELGVIYTSGTTSRPKGVIVTHANYLWSGEIVAKGYGLTPADRLIVTLPLFHANAQYYSTMGALQSGATLILLPRFSASRFIDQCIAHRATVASLFAAPIRMILLQEERPQWTQHTLRLVLFAQNLTAAELAAWDRRVGAPLLQQYGMTETIGPPLMNPLWGDRDHSTLGRVTVGYTCRVVRADGSDAAIGEPGELLVSGIPGTTLTRGYVDDPVATAAALGDGWLHTGDIVRVDQFGCFTFVDRSKDMIKRGGENVAASEIESVLADHPSVREVAVVGVPDPVRDEAIVAFVVNAGPPNAEELQAWCAERLATFRVPGQFVFCQQLPRTPVGKVQKHVLAARLSKSLSES
jgi:crotonobetaine/carnitine-CoA ligase